ncbi:MAG TPA: integrase [Hyphomonadaceae bacterium]|nr:integrase [Hyphomonadaceae bacterium]
MTARASRPDAHHALDLRPVLESAPLKPGVPRSKLSRFGDASWDLSPAVTRANTRRCHITAHFGDIDDARLVRTLKEFLYARLNVDLPGARLRLPPSMLRAYFNRIRRFLDFVVERLGCCDLSRVDQPLVDAYFANLRQGASRSRKQIAHLLQIVVEVALFSAHMPSGGLRFTPWRGRPAYQVAGARSTPGECNTPRLPESIIEPLLAWSIKYVNVFAPDILAAREEWERLKRRAARVCAAEAQLPLDARRRRVAARFNAFLETRAREGRGIPVWSALPAGHASRPVAAASLINRKLIELIIVCPPNATQRRIDRLQTALPQLGAELGGMDTPISIDPDTGRPWRSRFDQFAIQTEERMLQAAIYVVCAYLTGMRDSEVQAMQAGCCRSIRGEDGVVMRHRIRSVAYKGKRAVPEPADWVTIAPVADAVKVLHRLTARIRAADGEDGLWRVLHPKSCSKTHVSAEIVRTLNQFRDHLNAQFGSPGAPIIPPGPDDRPWRITTRQFRRTIAWHIANRPFGAVAGMIQYKHASVAAFEGYAGSSQSGFRAEIARERALGQLDDIMTYFDAHQDGLSLSGPASSRVKRSLDTAAVDLSPLPGRVADRARLRTLLKDLARTLYVGPLADCFFDPAHALCLKRATDIEREAPAMALCEPTRCPNACFTTRHKPVWAKARDDAALMLKEKRLSSAQRTILKADVARYAYVVDAIGADQPEPISSNEAERTAPAPPRNG